MTIAGTLFFASLILVSLTNLVALIISLGIGLWQTRAVRIQQTAEFSGRPKFQTKSPFISVHVAVHDEPPVMVIATIKSLAALNYSNFEVIVIDNNTPKIETWAPVRDFIANLDSRFRFFHVDGLIGAKAGALNYAIAETSQKAQYVAVVDADYQVCPDFLTIAAQHCRGAGDFVQFPQAYRSAERAQLVVTELQDYFRIFPNAANEVGTPLLTGTLSVVSIDDLRAVGGWPTSSITEDAELGLALLRHGTEGRYVNQRVGTGLLPLDLKGLRLQRQRWVAGNVQTLRGLLARPLCNRGWSGLAAVVGQLTAWASFLAIPLLVLSLVTVLSTVEQLHSQNIAMLGDIARTLSAVTLAVSFAGLVLRAVLTGRVEAILVSTSMQWTSSFAWLPALAGTALRFKRTPKALVAERENWSLDTLVSLIALVVSCGLLAQGHLVVAFLLALSCTGLVTGRYVDARLREASRVLVRAG